MHKARDTQRAKLYRAEREALPGYEVMPTQAGLDVAECEVYVRAVWGSPWTKRHFERAKLYSPPAIKDGRGTRWARGSLSCLNLPLWARTEPVILHEVAHALSGHSPAHGWQFALSFLMLVQHFLGVADAKALKAAYRKHHVRWKPKRKMNPEVLAVLRARGRALAAARRPEPEAAYDTHEEREMVERDIDDARRAL